MSQHISIGVTNYIKYCSNRKSHHNKCHKWITNYSWICSILLLDAILWENWITTAKIIAGDENGPLSEVQTAVGLEVSLPCDLIPAGITLIQDKVTLVIWYRENNAKPIYTFDARGKPLQQAVHWADQEVLKSKAQFHYDSHPPALRLRNVKREDAGLYRCRVDFQKSPTRNWRINLAVLVPPTQLIILDTQGAASMENLIGPYREGENINLTCMSSGGVPPPRVSWWKEHALLDDSFQILPDGSVKNILHISKLERKDLNTVYTCQASNGHVVPPLSSTVKLDMKLPPLYVRLQGLNHPLISGVRTQISCSSAGARPPPQILWNKGGSIMKGASQTTSSDGNVTVSELVFLPAPEDDGKLITCSVTTDTIAGGADVFIKDSKSVDVKHAPIVSLSLGAPLNPLHLVKGSDVYLECGIKANPLAKRVEWYHNDRQLHSSRGIIIANQTLVLQSITKAIHGQYMCRATNLQGTVGSNEVYVDVKYPPVCSADSTVIKAAIKQIVNITCRVDANPMINLSYKWTFNNTLETLIDLPTIEGTSIDAQSTSGYSELDPYSEAIYTNVVVQQPQHNHYSGKLKHHPRHQPDAQASPPLKTHYSPFPFSNVYPYKVETFQHFGTVSCIAHNHMGQSGPCLFHIMAAEIPDPVNNCTAFNSTANSVQVACQQGRDGGIQQYFLVEIYDENNRTLLYNTTFKSSDFLLKRLPSDSIFSVKVTSYNLQGSSMGYRFKTRTLPPPLLRTASSTAVFVQLTPLLGALVGVVVTLLLVTICIVIFVKVRTKKNCNNTGDNGTSEPDKGSAEPLSRDMGSHSSLDDKNPDVVPQENSDDEFISEEKAFDRITMGDSHRILYTPHHLPSPTISPTRNILSTKTYGELSLTTNPAYALYNSPQRRPPPLYQSPLTTTIPSLLNNCNNNNNTNIYTRIPTRAFTPYSETRVSPVSPIYGGASTVPLLLPQSNGIAGMALNLKIEEDS